MVEVTQMFLQCIASSLKLDDCEWVDKINDNNCVLIVVSTCSMNPETAVTCTHDHLSM